METIGHQKQREFLKKTIKDGSFAHAYLFSGQEKLGKRKIALETVSLLLGEENREQHPDLKVIEPAEGEIKIGQIRDLILWLSLKPYSGQFKGAIIDSAQSMNQDAQTALLKTLEEPKGRTVLILISENSEHLLPAILSRVQKVRFYPVRKEEIKKYLKNQNISQEKAEEISGISLGRPGLAVEYATEPGKLEFYKQKVKELNSLSKSELSLRFQCAKDLSEKFNEIRETLDVWTVYFRNVLLDKLFSPSVDWPGIKKTKKILNAIQSTRLSILTTNASARLALESLMLEL